MAKKHEEMLTIPGHKGNANQNHIKIPPHSCCNVCHQEHKQQQMLEKMWGKRNACTLLVGMHNHYRKQNGDSSKNQK
jgi:hypothetical protein